jgi:hypothetical protein
MNGRFDAGIAEPTFDWSGGMYRYIRFSTWRMHGDQIYDVFMDATKALIEWMYGSFEEVYIYKPCTSRPANLRDM